MIYAIKNDWILNLKINQNRGIPAFKNMIYYNKIQG